MLAVLLSSAAVACTSDNNVVEQTEKSESNKVRSYIGKPGAPITLDYILSKKNLKPGEEFNVQLSFQSSVESPIIVKASSFKKLTLLNSQKNWQTGLTKSGHRETLPALNLIALENGTFYIKLLASVEQNGQTFYKPFVIPVVIGDGAIQLQPVGEVVIDDNGQKIIIQKGDSSN